MFPNWYELQTQYFALPQDQRRSFLASYPELSAYWEIPAIEQYAGVESERVGPRETYQYKFPNLNAYWEWKRGWEAQFPELVPYINGQAYQAVDLSQYPPMLLNQIMLYALTGEPLSSGAEALLDQIWIGAGWPAGSVEAYLNSALVPTVMQQGATP